MPPSPSRRNRFRSGLALFTLAVLGLVVVAGVSLAASRLSSQHIGLSSEPLTAGQRLSPTNARAKPTSRPKKSTRTTRSTTTTSKRTTSRPQAAPPITTHSVTTAPPQTTDNHGGRGSGDGSSSHGGGSGGHGSDD